MKREAILILRLALWLALVGGSYGVNTSSAIGALPEGRVYEMVSPAYKGGYSAGVIMAAAPDGESLAFESLGVFAGVAWDSTTNMYLARRNQSGWDTTSLQPPLGSGSDLSANLDHVLAGAILGENLGIRNKGFEAEYLLHATNLPNDASSWEPAGGIKLKLVDGEPVSPSEQGASGDLCHIALSSAGGAAMLSEATGTTGQLYDLARGCDGEPYLRLVGVNNIGHAINPNCPAELGLGPNYDNGAVANPEQDASSGAMAGDGRTIFFTMNVEKGASCGSGVHQLFARMDDARTVEVSRPLDTKKPFGGCGAEGEVPCPGSTSRASAYFKGASEDGHFVLFTTNASLVSSDKDSGNDLYLATIGCPASEPECEPAEKQVTSLNQISHSTKLGEAADVQGVLRTAQIGARTYFVARGVLSAEANMEGQTADSGADNLYVYNPQSGTTVFVAELCSGPEESGEDHQVLRCPQGLVSGLQGESDIGLWGFASEAQSNPDGRFIVFSSFGQLMTEDTDTARDVYRYDAVSGKLTRVSVGENGFDANGNRDHFNAEIQSSGVNPGTLAFLQHELGRRAISDDGSAIVFSTADPLSLDAVNGMTNVYEWRSSSESSHVSLISSGNSSTSDSDALISPDGQNIFFVTSGGLSKQDTEGEADIYDARQDGGFPLEPTSRQSCSGDGCQGPLTNPPPQLIPGSFSQAPEEVSVRSTKKAVRKVMASKKAKGRGRKKRPRRKNKVVGRK